MTRSRPSFNLSAPIVLVAALALALTVFLNVGKLDRTLGEVQQSRLRFTLGELRSNLETGLDLGLTVQGLGNAQAALDEERRLDPDIVSISILGPDGALVFNSGTAPASLRTAGAQRDWVARSGDLLVVGTTLKNNLGQHAGALVLRYSSRAQDSAVGLIARELSLAALCALLVTAVCFVQGIRLLLRRMDATLASMEGALGARFGAGGDRYAADLVEQVNRKGAAALHDIQAAQDRLARGEPPR